MDSWPLIPRQRGQTLLRAPDRRSPTDAPPALLHQPDRDPRSAGHPQTIQLDNVRTALDYLEAQLQVSHPLAHEEFRTDGISLFIERYGTLINASAQGQTQLKAVLTQHLERIEPDDTGLAIKLYPFTRSDEAHNPRIVVIDPRIAFGRLVIDGTGIPTHIIAERYKAGDSLQDLVEDYDCDLSQIEEAIRCEIPLAA